MKKLVLVVCLLVASLAARAQFEQGKWIINPSLTGLNFSYSNMRKSTVWYRGESRCVPCRRNSLDGGSKCRLE